MDGFTQDDLDYMDAQERAAELGVSLESLLEDAREERDW